MIVSLPSVPTKLTMFFSRWCETHHNICPLSSQDKPVHIFFDPKQHRKKETALAQCLHQRAWARCFQPHNRDATHLPDHHFCKFIAGTYEWSAKPFKIESSKFPCKKPSAKPSRHQDLRASSQFGFFWSPGLVPVLSRPLQDVTQIAHMSKVTPKALQRVEKSVLFFPFSSSKFKTITKNGPTQFLVDSFSESLLNEVIVEVNNSDRREAMQRSIRVNSKIWIVMCTMKERARDLQRLPPDHFQHGKCGNTPPWGGFFVPEFCQTWCALVRPYQHIPSHHNATVTPRIG